MNEPLEHATPDIENDAYNDVGEHLRNDEDQSKMTIVAAILAGIGCSLLVVAVIL